jgi:hypothetical protein
MDGFGAEGPGFAGAVTSGDADDLGAGVINKSQLARVQVSTDARKEFGGINHLTALA